MNENTSLTVQGAAHELLRRLGVMTIFGNPGSTELSFLSNLPSDFQFVLALQEASAVAMADGYAQATGKPALVNVHTFAGSGNGMGNLQGAYMNKVPLIVLCGNQTREMLLGEVYLTDVEETTLPKPRVKWSYQPVRAEDVPAALMRAYAYLPDGTELLQITSDPNEAATAFVGDSMLGHPQLALEAMIDLVPEKPKHDWPGLRPLPVKVSSDGDLLYANEAFSILAESRPADSILVVESESNTLELVYALALTKPAIAMPESFYSSAAGCLGWGAPAAVGVALALRNQGVKRPVVAVIGDGAFQYSIQCLYTAAQHKLPVVFFVVRNGEYAVLKDFAVLEKTPNVPGLDLPGLDIPAIAKGFGCQAVEAKSKTEIREAFVAALGADSPMVITIPVQPESHRLA